MNPTEWARTPHFAITHPCRRLSASFSTLLFLNFVFNKWLHLLLFQAVKWTMMIDFTGTFHRVISLHNRAAMAPPLMSTATTIFRAFSSSPHGHPFLLDDLWHHPFMLLWSLHSNNSDLKQWLYLDQLSIVPNSTCTDLYSLRLQGYYTLCIGWIPQRFLGKFLPITVFIRDRSHAPSKIVHSASRLMLLFLNR